MDVALAYKSRWNIEAFFKWMKQHLRIKEFYGTSENAVKIQIYSVITAYCLVALAERTETAAGYANLYGLENPEPVTL